MNPEDAIPQPIVDNLSWIIGVATWDPGAERPGPGKDMKNARKMAKELELTLEPSQCHAVEGYYVLAEGKGRLVMTGAAEWIARFLKAAVMLRARGHEPWWLWPEGERA